MSNDGAGAPKAIVPLAPKMNAKSEAGDELDRAGHAILGALHKAVSAADAKYQQAVETNYKLSAELRSAAAADLGYRGVVRPARRLGRTSQPSARSNSL